MHTGCLEFNPPNIQQLKIGNKNKRKTHLTLLVTSNFINRKNFSGFSNVRKIRDAIQIQIFREFKLKRLCFSLLTINLTKLSQLQHERVGKDFEARRHYCLRDRMAGNATETRNKNLRTKNQISQGYTQARAKNIQLCYGRDHA